MTRYYIDKDTGLKYKFLQDDLVKAYEETYAKQQKERVITKQEFNQMLSNHPKLYLGVEAIRKHMAKATTPKSIDDVCRYGEVFAKNPRAFLVVSEMEDELELEIKEVMEHKDYPVICVRATKANLHKIFMEYAASDSFNKVAEVKDVLIYYRRKIDMVEAMVLRIFNRPKLTEALLRIVKDLKDFICAAERPGIPQTWYVVNPNLRFYAAGFDVIEECPELYNDIKDAKLGFELDYLPELDELEERKKYFEERNQYFYNERKKSKEQNYHYDDVDFYQYELRTAIDIYFETTVKEVLESGL